MKESNMFIKFIKYIKFPFLKMSDKKKKGKCFKFFTYFNFASEFCLANRSLTDHCYFHYLSKFKKNIFIKQFRYYAKNQKEKIKYYIKSFKPLKEMK